ncbi:MAG TPA: c-type cytochrome [Gaiellaceae bacterium]|nr:c-type cytochrome [Gaiellaceae bacterium]
MKPPHRVWVLGAGLAVVALLAAGCGYGGAASAAQRPDTQNGQQLFSQKCAACHTLAAAGASGTIGPNLDNAFAGDRAQGYPDSSIENVVLDQIRLGSGPIATYTTNKKFTPQTQMPANLVTGQDAIDVAAYVASVAGAGGYTTASGNVGTNGEAIFKANCSSCHTLAAAGTTGTVGPNLDQLASKLTMAIVVHQVTNGGAIMPAFKGKLSTAQIQAVAKYVTSVAGKKK